LKYTYDNIYEINEVYQLSPNPATLETFSYDGVGNRTTDSDYSNYSYNSNNQLTSYDSIALNYDKNGNLTKKTESGTDDTIYTFDYENKITRIDYPDETYSAYKYDAMGRRIEKRDRSGNISRYAYDGQNFVAECDGSNDLLASYVQGLGIDRPISMFRGGATYWYHSDALGSIHQMTDSDQAVQRSYDYSAFGKIISETGMLTNPFTYTAREYDSDSGLYDYRARYYDANVGRFLQRDPISGAGAISGQNFPSNIFYPYKYVRNNPTRWIDPTGLCELETCNRMRYLVCVGNAFRQYDKDLAKCQDDWKFCTELCVLCYANPACWAACLLGCEIKTMMCSSMAADKCNRELAFCRASTRCEGEGEYCWIA
jgi:RHS repeat-associated protein